MIACASLREWTAMLAGAIAEVKAAHPRLSELDSICGDGDHGTTMLRAANLLEKCIGQSSGKSLEALLNDVAWALMGLDGGATGPLLGSFFLGVSESVGSRNELDARSLAEVLEGGLAALARQSRAQVGDKSMLDALVPAIKALRRSADEGQSVQNALRAAALAAEEGAASTKDLVAKIGRARYLGEKTRGTPDPGATSVSLLFKGFHHGIETLEP
jgi:phosphoenolpyruvate---glycerone phosphotransferase subunit DhaL